MIPYVISEAHPDYKRPWLSQDFGVVVQEEIETYFLDRVCNFILERTHPDNLKSEYHIQNFFNSFYEDSFMSNSPWNAMVFINGEWEDMTPCNEKIWEHIQLMKLHEKEDKQNEEIEQNTENEQFEKSDFELSEKEKDVLKQLKDFFEKMLKEKPLPPEHIESLQKLTELQQLSALFNIYLTNENYNQNKYLFQGFLNLSVKIIQKDIDIITKKMETDESEELHKALEYALASYSSAMFTKQTFNF